MKNHSKNYNRLIWSFSILVLLTITFSCAKEKPTPEPYVIPPQLVAKAKLNFVEDGMIHDFKSYENPDFIEATLIQDTSLTFIFNTVSEEGKVVDGPLLVITIYNKDGFSVGQVYTSNDNPSEKRISLDCSKQDGVLVDYYAGNKNPLYNKGISELKITSYDGQLIRASFKFTAHSKNVYAPVKQLLITNGTLKCTINV